MRIGLLSVVLAICLPGLTWAQADRPMDCKTGPVDKTVGGTAWLLYSCSDGRTILLISAADSPAAPFYFLIYPDGDRLMIEGEGTGNRAATAAAVAELRKFEPSAIVAWIAETKRPRKAE